MAARFRKKFAAVTLSTFAITLIVVASLTLTAGSVSAKSHKSNSGGAGGNSGQSSGSHGNSGTQNESQGKSEKIKIKTQHGRNAGELKNHNAVNSYKTGQGYQNASTNSNVGQIATLKEVVSRTTMAKTNLATAQMELATHLDQNPNLVNEEIDALVAKTDPLSDVFDPAYVPSVLEANTLKLIGNTKIAQANFDEMAASFDEALLAASGGRVLSDGALQYFKTKLGF